jgi:hypothetical protein
MTDSQTDRPLPNAARPLITPTYDGSGEAVHPDILFFPNGWRGWEYWLVITPYPGDDTSKENPSILVSHDGITWREPAGIANPIALPRVSFLADGDLFYDAAADRLCVYYVHQRINRRTHLMRKSSADGVHWGPQTTEPADSLFDVPDFELLSPAVVQIGATWWMWSVNTGAVGCHAPATKIEYRTSADGIHWSAAADVHCTQPGYFPWHVDVIHAAARGEFWMLFSAFPHGGSCHDTTLFFARSTDGIRWTTFGRPALAMGADRAWDRNQIYRATLLHDADRDRLRVWYSADDGAAWRIGYSERDYSEFIEALSD